MYIKCSNIKVLDRFKRNGKYTKTEMIYEFEVDCKFQNVDKSVPNEKGTLHNFQ